MKLIAAALGLIILVSFGCHRTSSSRDSDHPSDRQVELAYQLIDEGRHSDAIDLFWDLLHQEDTANIRIGLASAYAARAGIQVQSYWELVIPSVKSQPPQTFESTERLKNQWDVIVQQLPMDLQKVLSSQSENVLKANDQLETLKWRFQRIPLITSMEQVGDLTMARSVIQNLPSKGVRLYRSLLTLILIRYEVNESSQQLQKALETMSARNPCSPHLKAWLGQLQSPLNLMADLITDVKVAYPSKINDIAKFEKDFNYYRPLTNGLLNLLSSSLCRSY